MDQQQLEALYKQLVELSNAGDEAGAQKLIKERFAELPEDLQGEILARMYFANVQREIEDVETLASVQERALSSLDMLEALKKKLEAENT